MEEEMKMGLVEKQAWATFKENLPARLERLHKVTGTTIELSFDEESFKSKDSILTLGNSFCDRLISAMEDICKDNLGKTAVAEAVKKVVCKYKPEGGFGIDLKEGQLAVTGKFEGSGGTDFPGPADYKKYLMSHL
jgi:hypothetical protein